MKKSLNLMRICGTNRSACTAIKLCEQMSMRPTFVTYPISTKYMKFMITAHTPYLIKVVKARASIRPECLLNRISAINTHKNRVAVGLSGTNGQKYSGVSDNCPLYQ